ncbi:MAG: transcriptional regulator, ArsR family [Polyangiaceae bacterium]|jgi:uncharacterized protein YndB with AHSA1/START domain|nr:transcriptional regulator, ArsR family [Polyangiaceae bacterium]
MNNHSQRQVHELFIQASAEKLWESLTNGDLTPAYFFGTVVKSSFERGAPIRFDLPDGTPTVDGVVLECEPRKRLVHTWKIRYDAALEDETSTVEWQIEPRGKACRVIAIHDFAQAPKTAAHLGEGQDGWSVVLSGLKTFLETGKPLDLPMAG